MPEEGGGEGATVWSLHSPGHWVSCTGLGHLVLTWSLVLCSFVPCSFLLSEPSFAQLQNGGADWRAQWGCQVPLGHKGALPHPQCPPWASPPTMVPPEVLQPVLLEPGHTVPALRDLGQVGQIGTWHPELGFLICERPLIVAPMT